MKLVTRGWAEAIRYDYNSNELMMTVSALVYSYTSNRRIVTEDLLQNEGNSHNNHNNVDLEYGACNFFPSCKE